VNTEAMQQSNREVPLASSEIIIDPPAKQSTQRQGIRAANVECPSAAPGGSTGSGS